MAKANVEMNIGSGGFDHTPTPIYGENLWAALGTGFGISQITGMTVIQILVLVIDLRKWVKDAWIPNFSSPTKTKIIA